MMKRFKRYACLTFHTERLHDDRVWQLVKDTVRFLNSKSIPATWFSIAPVHPVYINRRFSPDKWLQRLQELISKNQLIEQHTHFYKETKGPYDLSLENLEKRLLEDKNWLVSHGFKIKGFVGGGWAINKDLLKLLIKHDYLYDCSVAGFKSNYSNVMTAPIPTKFTLQSKYLVEIPTFSRLSLKRALSLFALNKNRFSSLNNI